uniref:Exocyst complex component 3 n=1 Tax=Daphnia galeata TaxID=27404 RepID=A0A8J2WKE5_9CRUS|nr:unnamed protein product [Daphnia galeata]
MNIELLQEEAILSASISLSSMLQRPDQLEKVEQYKQRVTRKKTSVEAMLKTAVQSQLDGVVSGLQQLQSALVDINDIRQRLHEIEECITTIPTLCESVKNVQQEHVVYSQYAVAMENLKHIFTVPERGEMLHAHHSLDLKIRVRSTLYELHGYHNHLARQTTPCSSNGRTVRKELRLLLGSIFKYEPQVIVTAVRIIEREERADAYAIQRQKQSGFMSPDRPKKWKARALEVLSDAVIERIEGNQFEERIDNKMWLVRHLEVTRLLIIEDLRVVKTLCSPCFPPHWDIVNQFFHKYHTSLSKHLEEVIAAGLVGNEFVTLLSWVLQTYPGPELLRHPDVNIDPISLGSLLSDVSIEKLFQAYISNMAYNYNDWMQKTVETEARDWRRPVVPESDGDGHYHTESIVIIFQMVEQNLSVSCTISNGLMMRALILGLEQIAQYGEMYREAINLFKNKHFEDRSQVPYFTHYMIAIINNCLHAMELSQQMRNRNGNKDSSLLFNKFEILSQTYDSLRNEAAGFLLDEAFLDLEPHFQDLLTRKWVMSTVPVDTICATLEDYFQDYIHLKPRNFKYVIRQAEICITRKYITSIFQKKLSLKDERREVAEKIIQEAGQIEALLAPASLNRDLLTDAPKDTEDTAKAISALAEVIKCDSEIITLELINFLKKYPDVTQDQLICLLSLRGDFGRLEARQRVADLLSSSSKEESARTTIFSMIVVPSSIFS